MDLFMIVNLHFTNYHRFNIIHCTFGLLVPKSYCRHCIIDFCNQKSSFSSFISAIYTINHCFFDDGMQKNKG